MTTLAAVVFLILAIAVAARLTASSGGGGDPEEYTAEITAFSPEDPPNDALVGGPHAGQDERGRVYTLEDGAPLVQANLPLDVLEALADLEIASPFDVDYRFGQRVAALYDLTGDGMIELRIKSFALDQANSEFALTHIFSSSDGAWLFTTAATDDFDP